MTKMKLRSLRQLKGKSKVLFEVFNWFIRTTKKGSTNNKSTNKKLAPSKRRKTTESIKSTEKGHKTESASEESENQSNPSDGSNESEETDWSRRWKLFHWFIISIRFLRLINWYNSYVFKHTREMLAHFYNSIDRHLFIKR